METVKKPINWTARSLKDIDKITRFNSKLYGVEKAILISNSIAQAVKILDNENFADLGSVDKDFDYLSRNYRKIFYNHCKITYREGNTKIYICRVFDTRQNPNKNK